MIVKYSVIYICFCFILLNHFWKKQMRPRNHDLHAPCSVLCVFIFTLRGRCRCKWHCTWRTTVSLIMEKMQRPPIWAPCWDKNGASSGIPLYICVPATSPDGLKQARIHFSEITSQTTKVWHHNSYFLIIVIYHFIWVYVRFLQSKYEKQSILVKDKQIGFWSYSNECFQNLLFVIRDSNLTDETQLIVSTLKMENQSLDKLDHHHYLTNTSKWLKRRQVFCGYFWMTNPFYI